MATTFEATWLGDYAISGDIHMHEGPRPPQNWPVVNNIVQCNQELTVHFRWDVRTSYGEAFNPQCKFLCRVYLEQMGPGEGPDNFEGTCPIICQDNQHYNYYINIHAGDVPAGAYRMVCTLTMLNPSNNPLPVAAFADLGIIQFYET